MTGLENILRSATSDLEQINAPFALVGGIAVGIHTQPRTTQDADFAVAVSSDKSAEKIIYQLAQRNYKIISTLEHEPDGYLSTVRLRPAHLKTDAMVDILFASSGIEKEIVHEAITMTVMGMTLKVASIEHLLAMKLLSYDSLRRQTDIADIFQLIDYANSRQLNKTRHLVKLITARGYNRDRDLIGDLENFIQKAQQPCE